MLDFNEWDWSDSLKSQLSYVINEQKNLKKIELSLREMINGIALEGERKLDRDSKNHAIIQQR